MHQPHITSVLIPSRAPLHAPHPITPYLCPSSNAVCFLKLSLHLDLSPSDGFVPSLPLGSHFVS